MRTISLDSLDRLAHPDTVIGTERAPDDGHYLSRHPRQKSYFDLFWSLESDRKLLRVLNSCGLFSTNYLYDAFCGDFVDHIPDFGAQLSAHRKRRKQASIINVAEIFYSKLTDFLFGMAGEAIRSGRAAMLNRRRRCTLSGETFDDSEHGGSVSFHRRRLPKVEVLNYWLDIGAFRMDAFRRLGDPEDVIASLDDYRTLIDALGFYPAEGSNEVNLLSNIRRERFCDVLPLMERCFFPARYAKVYGNHVSALFATGCLGREQVVRARMGYRVVADDVHICYSLAEKMIDDWMHRSGIRHEKEPPYPEAVQSFFGGRVRADWRVGDVYVEFFGLQSKTDYARKTDAKITACLATGVPVVALYPGDEFRLDRALSSLTPSARPAG